MRNVFPCALVLVFLAGPGYAENARQQAAPIEQPAQASLDDLFAELKRSGNETAATRIAARIERAWARSGSRSIDLMMRWSADAMQARKFDVALDFLDQVVTLSPDYAEGWNRRASVHFMMDSHAMSMADIDRTLRLEPRHFGALAGMARILEQSGHKERALEAYERALAIYPMMRSVQDKVGSLSDELAGQGI